MEETTSNPQEIRSWFANYFASIYDQPIDPNVINKKISVYRLDNNVKCSDKITSKDLLISEDEVFKATCNLKASGYYS